MCPDSIAWYIRACMGESVFREQNMNDCAWAWQGISRALGCTHYLPNIKICSFITKIKTKQNKNI